MDGPVLILPSKREKVDGVVGCSGWTMPRSVGVVAGVVAGETWDEGGRKQTVLTDISLLSLFLLPTSLRLCTYSVLYLNEMQDEKRPLRASMATSSTTPMDSLRRSAYASMGTSSTTRRACVAILIIFKVLSLPTSRHQSISNEINNPNGTHN